MLFEDLHFQYYIIPFFLILVLYLKFLFGSDLDTSGAYRCYTVNKIKLKDIMLSKNNSYSFFTESALILWKKNYKI